jgi:hypothetical protein
MCHAHFERWRKTGDVNAAKPVTHRVHKWESDARCDVGGCDASPSGGGRGMHYARQLRHGDPLYEREKPTVCAAEGCEREPFSRDLCIMHYTRWLRHGDLETHWPALKPNSEVTYNFLHERLRKARGNATDYQCVRCPAQAVNWAWIHGADPADFGSYTPMCRSCHMKYDLGPERYHERTTPRREKGGVA